MKVSVLIITYQRKHLLQKCLQSLKDQHSHAYEIEVLIFVNGRDTRSAYLSSQFDLNTTVESSETTQSPALARNRLLPKVSGQYVLFLDDDVELPLDYFQKSYVYASKNHPCFGGPDVLPKSPTLFQQALSVSQKLWMSSAHTRYRHGVKASPDKIISSGEELILCNLWLKPELLTKHDLSFDGRFYRNEENILIYQLIGHGVECLFAPELYVHHFKKDTLIKALKAIASSGYHRALSFRYYPRSTRLIYFIPTAFVLFLLLGFLIEPRLYLGVLVLYLSLGFINLMINAIRERYNLKIICVAWCLQILTNLTYGAGFLGGLVDFRR
jgi:glycosyltransferase involved in cell wall biosynthesis